MKIIEGQLYYIAYIIHYLIIITKKVILASEKNIQSKRLLN